MELMSPLSSIRFRLSFVVDSDFCSLFSVDTAFKKVGFNAGSSGIPAEKENLVLLKSLEKFDSIRKFPVGSHWSRCSDTFPIMMGTTVSPVDFVTRTCPEPSLLHPTE